MKIIKAYGDVRRIKILSVLIALGALLFVIIIIPQPIPLNIKITLALAVIIFDALFIGILINKIRSVNKKISKVENIIKIDNGKIKFTKPLKAEMGYLNMWGKWVSTGNATTYSTRREFIAEKSGKFDSIEIKKKKFEIAIRKNGEGTASLPCVKIAEDELKDTVICYINPSYNVKINGTIRVFKDTDYAEAEVKSTESGIKLFIRAKISKARKAKVKIKYKDVEELIGETRDFGEFEYRFIDEPTIIISTYDVITPRDIIKNLNRSISGHGKYKISLVLDMPLRKDVENSVDFEVSG